MKSNRFLKLEAGNNSCKFPASAFNKEEKLKVLNAMNKKTIDDSLGLGPGMVKVFEKIAPAIEYLFVNYRTKYDQCISKKQAYDEAVRQLNFYSHNAKTPKENPCKTYEDLKENLWSQTENTDWAEDKLAFTNDVAITGKLEDMVTQGYLEANYSARDIDTAEKRTVIRKDIYQKRVEARKKCLDALNELRKAIFETTHVELKRAKVSELFGHVNPSGMPKDYKDKLVTALSKDKCPKARCYAGKDSDKVLTTSFSSLSDAEIQIQFAADVVYLQRVAAMNLLDEFGFKDAPRKKVGVDLTAIPPKLGEVPPVPKTDNPSSFAAGSVMYQETWNAYVNSLNAIPPIDKDKSTFGAAFKEGLFGEFSQKFLKGFDSDWNILKSLQEKKTWGEGKKGQILFAADSTTYALQNKQLNPIEVLKPTVNGLEPENENDAINGFLKEIKKCLLKL